MKLTKKITASLLAFLMISACFPFAFAAETDNRVAENNTDFAIKTAEIIKDEENPSEMLRIMGKLNNAAADFVFPYAENSVVSQDGRFALQFSSEQELLDCLDKLSSNPDILYAERDCAVFTGAVEETDEYLSWGVKAIEADIYSQSITPSSGDSVTVAIVDSGCEDIDFIKDKLVDGYDFFDNDSDATNDTHEDSHGTFLASVVADCVGTLPVKIMPVRVLSSKTGSLINLINGIIYAVDNGADIINISLVTTLSNCQALENAVAYAEENGVTVVVCAGNALSDVKNFCPSHCESALTVTSVNSDSVFSESFSNYGNEVDLAAPGEYISGYNASGEITYLSGTSMSAAFVSAAAAMFVLDNPDCSSEQIRTALTSSAEDLGTQGRDICYGWGVPKLGYLIKPAEVKITNNPGTKTINCGETLRLTAEIINGSENFEVWWYVDGIKSGEGETFEISPSGRVGITAKLVDSNGNAVLDSQGIEISDSETVTVNSGFFQRIISFFKNLFRINRTVVQAFKSTI